MRKRERETMVSKPIYCGTSDFDSTRPYNRDGPWVWPSDVEYGKSSPGDVPVWQERTVDELHPGPPYKTGGPFNKVEFDTDQYEVRSESTYYGWKYRYCGGFLPSYMPSALLDWGSLDDFELSDFGNVSHHGATGWNKFRPTRSGAELGVFLGEIKDVPRMLRTTAKGFHNLWRSMGGSPTGFGPKAVANHWLNTQFGWMPFVSDLRNFYETTTNLDKKLKQLRRDNGKWVRRGGTITTKVESEKVMDDAVSGHYPALSSYFYVGTPAGKRIAFRRNAQRVWFRGAFRYWIPGTPDSNEWKGRALAQLYGLQPSPSLLWELTPWSWLIDWCSNAGDAVGAISSMMFDNLTAKYAYVMGTTEQKVVYSGTSYLVDGPITDTWYASMTRKTRVEASPFGFGLTPADFSARQWSILSALGLTRLR